MCGHECDCDCHPFIKTIGIFLPWVRCLKCECTKCPVCSKMIPKVILDLHVGVCHTAVKSMSLPKNFSDRGSRYQLAA